MVLSIIFYGFMIVAISAMFCALVVDPLIGHFSDRKLRRFLENLPLPEVKSEIELPPLEDPQDQHCDTCGSKLFPEAIEHHPFRCCICCVRHATPGDKPHFGGEAI